MFSALAPTTDITRGLIFRGAYDPGDVTLAVLELSLIQPTTKKLTPEP
jgi:hypothetical protein